MKKLWILVAVILLVSSTVLSGCTGPDEKNSQSSGASSENPPSSDQIAYGGSLVYGMTQDIVSLDPHLSTDAGTRSVVFNLYEGLVKPNEHGEIIPAVAKSYEISPDAREYVFSLREGVYFHDGTLVTADDVIYSIERYAELQGEDSAFSMSLASVEKVDDQTIKVVLSEGDSEFIYQLTLAVIPRHIGDIASDPVGCGPFAFKEYKAGQYLELVKNDKYYLSGVPYLDSVRFKFISDFNTAFTELRAGTIQVLNYLTASQVASLAPGDHINVVEGNMNLVHALFLNNLEEPLNDVKVRQALCYGIDRNAINQFLFQGKSTLIGSHMIPSLTTWYDESTAEAYPYDPEKAKELLNEAGFSQGFDLKITVPSSYAQHVDTAQIIADQLSQIGVRVSIQQVEWTTWLEEVYRGRKYQATVIGFDGALNPSDWLAKYQSSASNNMVNFQNSTYDEVFAKAYATVDTAEKASYYKELQRILSENAASVYIQDMADFVGVNDSFGGYVFYPTAAYDAAKIYQKANNQ